MGTEISTLFGPAELIAKLLEYRPQMGARRRDAYGNISDEGLCRLVTLSYFASQAVEEGRYARFRLFVPPEGNLPPGWRDPWQLIPFEQPVILQDIDDLRRLAPCAASHDVALEVQEQQGPNGSPVITSTGIRLAHSGDSVVELFSTSLWARRVRPGLMIRVDGPGELRISDGQSAWDLRAGKLSELGGIVMQPLASWLVALTKKMEGDKRPRKVLDHTLHFAWHELLHLISEQRHGGCLVILPKAGLTSSDVDQVYRITIKYPTTGPLLGKEVAGFVETCSKHVDANADKFVDGGNRWLRERQKLLSHVDALARISGVDGCVVFDADLRLVGFGGKIKTAQDGNTKRLVDARSNATLADDVMKLTGTRHLSAYNLCQAHEGVWCYVVSQDGQGTAFWSDALSVKRWAPYWPWAKMSDQF